MFLGCVCSISCVCVWVGGGNKYSHVGPGVKYVRYSIQKNSSLAEHIMKRII